jgi:hypothetical protein
MNRNSIRELLNGFVEFFSEHFTDVATSVRNIFTLKGGGK